MELEKSQKVLALQEECALVHWGNKRKNDLLKLVNIAEIDDIDKFKKTTINRLDYVMPDFLLFKDNEYLHNEYDTKTAGYPDLIIEVWSDGNDKDERESKLNLYSTSPITEHWYMEQDSNEVICYFGEMKIDNQNLTNVLVTLNGLEFDLRYLAN
jgi:Uma2 family endonuclease